MFCGKCGHKIDDDSLFCNSCGARAESHSLLNKTDKALVLQKLIDKLWAEIAFCAIKAVVWLVCFLFEMRESNTEGIIFSVIFLANIIVSVKDLFKTLEFANQIKIKPVGIVSAYRELKADYLSLTYLCFRRSTKEFVLKNEQTFLELEKEKFN